jgi:molybdopterin/thiamine biosynthesis adenylyltransferase
MFNYTKAFSRNLGWITTAEQEFLRRKRVAIAGLGGVGGSHLLTLVRLGIENFHIADFDTFELSNFNRQAGARISTLGLNKVDTLIEMAKDINPDLKIKGFSQGVTRENVDDFFQGVDLYVDSLDYFAFSYREIVFAACERLKIPVTTAGPIGMGVAMVNFLPGHMTFEEYFGWQGQNDMEKALRFAVGLAPALLHRGYLVDRSRVNFAMKEGPSTSMACDLCAGVAGTEALKILLGRGNILAAPWAMQFDAYRNKLAKTWRPGGMKNPLNQLALWLMRKQLKLG